MPVLAHFLTKDWSILFLSEQKNIFAEIICASANIVVFALVAVVTIVQRPLFCRIGLELALKFDIF